MRRAGWNGLLRPCCAAWLLAFGLIGCGRSRPGGEMTLRLEPPAGWSAVAPPSGVATVPGRPIAAWRGPAGAVLVAYRTLPAPGATARSLAEDRFQRLTGLPGVGDLARSVVTAHGREAARVELVAPGNGSDLAPSGSGTPTAPPGATLVPTREISVGLPEPAGPLWLCARFPDAARAQVAPQVEAMLGGR